MTWSRRSLAAFFVFTGIGHLTFARRFFEAAVPPWVPGSRRQVNQVAGAAEIGGALLALIPGAERPARRYLTVLLLAVYPANIHMAIKPSDFRGLDRAPRWLLWARLPLQFLGIAWVLRALPVKSGD